MMKQIWIIIGILAILVLSSCSSELRGQQVQIEVDENDPCFEVQCGQYELCSGGNCICQTGFKECNDQCIAEAACCADNECGIGETCVANTCTFSCENIQCESNKICSDQYEGCFCKDGYKWCNLQNKCIPDDHCCTKFDCGRDEKCVNTAIRSEVCVEKGDDKHCRILNDLEPKEYIVGGTKFEIFLEDYFYTDSVELKINEDLVNMTNRKRIQSKGAIVWLKDLREVGGMCKLFDSRKIDKT